MLYTRLDPSHCMENAIRNVVDLVHLNITLDNLVYVCSCRTSNRIRKALVVRKLIVTQFSQEAQQNYYNNHWNQVNELFFDWDTCNAVVCLHDFLWLLSMYLFGSIVQNQLIDF